MRKRKQNSFSTKELKAEVTHFGTFVCDDAVYAHLNQALAIWDSAPDTLLVTPFEPFHVGLRQELIEEGVLQDLLRRFVDDFSRLNLVNICYSGLTKNLTDSDHDMGALFSYFVAVSALVNNVDGFKPDLRDEAHPNPYTNGIGIAFHFLQDLCKDADRSEYAYVLEDVSNAEYAVWESVTLASDKLNLKGFDRIRDLASCCVILDIFYTRLEKILKGKVDFAYLASYFETLDETAHAETLRVFFNNSVEDNF